MKHTKDEETACLARVNAASPTRAIRESLANTYLQADHAPWPYCPQQQTQSNFTDPFSNGGGRGSLFGLGCGNLFNVPHSIGTSALGMGRGL